MSRLTKNIIYNFFGQGLVILLSFIAVKYIFKQLGDDFLGILYFTATLDLILIGFLDKGIYATVIREISSHFSSDPEYITRFIRTGSFLSWGLFIVFSVFIYVTAPLFVSYWINLKTLDAETATRILRILGVASLTAFPRSLFANILRGLQRMEFNNIVDVLFTSLQQLGTIIIIFTHASALDVIYWYVFCYLINLFAYFVICLRFIPFSSFLPRYYPNIFQQNRDFTLKMIYISILTTIHNQIQKLIVSKILPLGVFGYYGFAHNAVSKSSLLTSSISQATFPHLSSIHSRGRLSDLKSQFDKIQEFICFITIPVLFAIPFFSTPVFTFLFNAEIARALFYPALFLGLAYYLNGTLNLVYQLTLAVGKPEIPVKTHIYALFLVIPSTIILIKLFSLSGAGLSLIIFNLFVYIYTVPIVFRECIDYSVMSFYLRTVKFLFCGFVAYSLSGSILLIYGLYSLPFVITAYSFSSLLFLFVMYFFLQPDLKRIFFNYLKEFKFDPRDYL